MEVKGFMSDSGKILYLDRTPAESPSAAPQDTAMAVPLTEAEALAELVRILVENHMDPVLQLSGYLISEDPTYLPEGTDARSIARRIGRDGLLSALIGSYIDRMPPSEAPETDE